ncbi:ExbD/TolR family protein [Ideonella sp.]|uniref:ExbD/TolR family protein n=1 Tax=Ideonella sp. TaxID=1929293 RepID=UPI003BB6F82E
MAFGRLERTPASKPMSDINMTPLIDVMLVLLVIFMITAPLMASRLQLDLPKTDGAAAPADAGAALALSLDAQGQLYLGEQALSNAELMRQARPLAQRNPATEVQLRADAKVPYGRVAELIGQLQSVGLSRIGFVTAGPSAAASAP